MKQTFLIMVLALGMCSINMSAQTKKQSSTKRTTTSRSTNSQQGGQIMKFRQVGEDGYVWYKLKRGNLYGVRDADGNNIIPIKYDEVTYVCKIVEYAHNNGSYKGYRQDGVHYFSVKKGGCMGTYTREGTLVVSTERKYERVWLNIEYLKPYWLIHVAGEADAVNSSFGNGILDMKGNVIIPPKRYKYVHPFYYGLNVTDYNGKEGICDWNGKVIVPCQYENCWLKYDNGKYTMTYKESENGAFKDKIIEFDTSSNFDYQTYDNLCYNYDPTTNSSSSSSSSSKAASSSSSSSDDNKFSNTYDYYKNASGKKIKGKYEFTIQFKSDAVYFKLANTKKGNTIYNFKLKELSYSIDTKNLIIGFKGGKSSHVFIFKKGYYEPVEHLETNLTTNKETITSYLQDTEDAAAVLGTTLLLGTSPSKIFFDWLFEKLSFYEGGCKIHLLESQ